MTSVSIPGSIQNADAFRPGRLFLTGLSVVPCQRGGRRLEKCNSCDGTNEWRRRRAPRPRSQTPVWERVVLETPFRYWGGGETEFRGHAFPNRVWERGVGIT